MDRTDHMSMDAPRQVSPAPEFVAQVKDALNHLYDFPLIERHPLAQKLPGGAASGAETPGQRLRRELISAIESLNPGRNVPFRSPRARFYHLLVFHYVESMTIVETAHELGISRRQAHRDLTHGEQSIAAILWAHCAGNAKCPLQEGQMVDRTEHLPHLVTRNSLIRAEMASKARRFDAVSPPGEV